MTPVSTRLVRLLNMVPYFQANPRVTRAQAAADLGVSVKQLGEDLDQLWMCGLPGYSPGDLIDFASGLLGGHVGGGSHDRARLRKLGIRSAAGRGDDRPLVLRLTGRGIVDRSSSR